MNHGDLENLILHTIERWYASRYSEKHGLVTSFDPKRYLAKVMIQPGGYETGWLPIETGHIGDNFGIAVGLTPGDGKTTGDQVVVRFQGNDIESGKIVQRVHSDQDQPPEVQAGEVVIWTRFTQSAKPKSNLGDDTQSDGQGDQVGEQGAQGGSGQQIYLKNDGSITWTDGNGATTVKDGKGNVTLTCKNLTHTISGNHTVTIGGTHSISVASTQTNSVGGSKTETIGGDMNKTVSGKRVDNISSIWNAIAKFGNWSWLQDDDG